MRGFVHVACAYSPLSLSVGIVLPRAFAVCLSVIVSVAHIATDTLIYICHIEQNIFTHIHAHIPICLSIACLGIRFVKYLFV